MTSRTHQHFNVINTAAPGNAGFHEYFDLERTLGLDPDLVIVQFCLNDVTEPYHVYRRLGGRGFDYHRIDDFGYLNHLLGQYSAFYLFLQDVSARWHHLPERAPEEERRREIYSAENLVQAPDDPRIRDAWREYLSWLDAIVDLAASARIPVVLLASPFDFQLGRPSVDAHPQRILERFTSERRIAYVDWLDALQRVATASSRVLLRGEVDRRIAGMPAQGLARTWGRQFLDYDHPSASGHRFAAKLLLRPVKALIGPR